MTPQDYTGVQMWGTVLIFLGLIAVIAFIVWAVRQ